MTIIQHRDIRGLVGTLCGACIVTLVALGFSAAPARAQSVPDPTFPSIPFLPPEVKFISNGKFTGTLQIQGMTLPITGSVAYLVSGSTTDYLKISVDTDAGQQITSNSWVVAIPTVTDQWEIVSTFPTTCQNEVLSGASYPQCNFVGGVVGGEWNRTPKGLYVLACTVTAQGNKATLNFSAQLSADNTELVKLQETATITGENDETNSLTITMTEQGTTPPTPHDFNRPSVCNAPTATIGGENGNSQGNDLGCTGTIPNICF